MSNLSSESVAQCGEGSTDLRRKKALPGVADEHHVTAEANAPRKKAAQYLRVSTDQQRYSLQAQAETIQAYAALHGLDIVRSYVDAGKSGTTLNGRDGLKALISDVVNGHAGFEVVIVLNVSRWGRFQDPDQAAYYELICRQAGGEVEYCAEAFRNENTRSFARDFSSSRRAPPKATSKPNLSSA